MNSKLLAFLMQHLIGLYVKICNSMWRKKFDVIMTFSLDEVQLYAISNAPF